MLETLTSISAGADIILTYFARQAARLLEPRASRTCAERS